MFLDNIEENCLRIFLIISYIDGYPFRTFMIYSDFYTVYFVNVKLTTSVEAYSLRRRRYRLQSAANALHRETVISVGMSFYIAPRHNTSPDGCKARSCNAPSYPRTSLRVSSRRRLFPPWRFQLIALRNLKNIDDMYCRPPVHRNSIRPTFFIKFGWLQTL